MRRSLLVWGLVLLMGHAHAQSVAWSRLYPHPNSRGFLPQVAAADPQGNLIVAGRYIHETDPFNSVAIVKYAPNGDLLWTRTFGLLGSRVRRSDCRRARRLVLSGHYPRKQ